MTFGEVLKYFKEQDNLDSLVVLIDEPLMRKAIAVWKGVKVTFKEGIGECEDSLSDAEKWRWMWEQVEVSATAFGTLAGVKVTEAEPLLERLKALRLIFPDNDIGKRAADYLRAMMLKQIKDPRPEKLTKAESRKNMV